MFTFLISYIPLLREEGEGRGRPVLGVECCSEGRGTGQPAGGERGGEGWLSCNTTLTDTFIIVFKFKNIH